MNALLAHIKAENEKTAAWVAEDSANRWAGMIVEDLDHWAGYGVTTVAEYERYMMEASYVDLYKSVHGIKPRWVEFDNISDEELSADYDSLLVALEENNKLDAAREEAAVAAFESKVEELIGCGAGDRDTAIRWLRDAEDAHDDEYFEYGLGLPNGYLKAKADELTAALVTKINTSATTALADLL